MKINNNLDIFLITYNRKEQLEGTFKQILAKNSPIKDIPITILDNCSTDGTSQLCEEYAKQYPNIKHIRHNKNIGGNANITRAYEMVTKKYVWVLCDDDKFDFSHFKEISQAMEQDYDVILASNYAITDKYSLTQLVKQLTLVPAGIYKTKLITSTVLMNAYFNISNIFPQLALVCKAINDNCSFYIPKHGVVQVGIQEDGYSYTRGCDEENN
ncbi:MAG: glycosyltransferase family 2 protein, partial [Elusimicrobiaceae bacterium]|nr:glycosyltransferase family 2 protein [Elusimicrobiaceae bacterium]